MMNQFSRRKWIATILASTVATPICLAQGPSAAKLRVIKSASTMPIRSIGIRSADDAGTRVVVTAMASDPSGEFLAIACDDHLIRILSVATMGVKQTITGHRDVIRTLTFSPGGELLASAGNDGQLILWDTQDSFRAVQKMTATPALACVRFSRDGETLAAAGFHERVFLISKEKRPTLECDCKDLRAVAFRDDDAVLAVGGRSGNVHLFDPADGELLGLHQVHDGRIHEIVFHRDSNLAVSVGEDGFMCVLDTEGGQVRKRVAVTTGKLFTLAIIDSQRVAVAGSDNRIQIVNTDSGQIENRLEEHRGSIATLAASGGMLFSGGYDATLKRWPLGDLSPNRQRIAEVDPGLDR